MAEKYENFIPLEKQSKKEQKAFYAKKRGSWNGVNPVTKTVESRKLYNRKKAKDEMRKSKDEY